MTQITDETIEPYTLYVSEFNQDNTKQFCADFYKIAATKPDVIPVIIDSYGGEIHSLFAMIDIIQSVDTPVATVCIGKAMSAGAYLLVMGTKGYRYVAPTAAIMLHHVARNIYGKEPELVSDTKEATRVQKRLFDLFDRSIDKGQDFLLNELHSRGNTEWYLSAKEAYKLGMVDHIKLPVFTVTTETTSHITME